MYLRTTITTIILVAVSVLAITTTARADQPFMTVTGNTSIPVGHSEFCQSRPNECKAHRQIIEQVPLTEGLWQELLVTNASVNQRIAPVTDQDLYQVVEHWTYPRTHGDCEDYVLLKRRELIQQGWPASALLITVVRERSGDGHAVLTVTTDRGDVVLDNQNGKVLLWSQTPYQFIKRQSQSNAGIWDRVFDQNRNLQQFASN